MRTFSKHDDVWNAKYDSINPMETIQKALRKENREFIELAICNPLIEEGKEMMKIWRQDIEQFGVSAFKKKMFLIYIGLWNFLWYHYMRNTQTFSFYRNFWIRQDNLIMKTLLVEVMHKPHSVLARATYPRGYLSLRLCLRELKLMGPMRHPHYTRYTVHVIIYRDNIMRILVLCHQRIVILDHHVFKSREQSPSYFWWTIIWFHWRYKKSHVFFTILNSSYHLIEAYIFHIILI